MTPACHVHFKSMNTIETFSWSFFGSFAMEELSAYEAINGNNGDLPKQYRKSPFIAIKIILAVVAGGLAVSYGINTPLLALNVGVSTPLILRTFAKGLSSNH